MCGIAGLFKFERIKDKKEARSIIKALFKNIEIRGKDASGISFIDTKTNRVYFYKSNITAKDFIKKKSFNKLFNTLDYNCILIHARYKTKGNQENNYNNHPFYNKEHNDILIHNGIIINDEDLKRKYNLKIDGETDSEVILALYNKLKDNKESIKDAIDKLKGSMAFALYDDRKLYLYKDENPLYVCFNKDKNMFLFSSHEEIFKELFNTEKKEFYNIFIEEINKENFLVTELEDADLITIDFNLKKIDKEYAYSDNFSYISKATTKDEKKEEERINRLLKEENESIEDTYFKNIAEEEKENELRYKKHMYLEKINRADADAYNLINYDYADI